MTANRGVTTPVDSQSVPNVIDARKLLQRNTLRSIEHHTAESSSDITSITPSAEMRHFTPVESGDCKRPDRAAYF